MNVSYKYIYIIFYIYISKVYILSTHHAFRVLCDPPALIGPQASSLGNLTSSTKGIDHIEGLGQCWAYDMDRAGQGGEVCWISGLTCMSLVPCSLLIAIIRSKCLDPQEGHYQ